MVIKKHSRVTLHLYRIQVYHATHRSHAGRIDCFSNVERPAYQIYLNCARPVLSAACLDCDRMIYSWCEPIWNIAISPSGGNKQVIKGELITSPQPSRSACCNFRHYSLFLSERHTPYHDEVQLGRSASQLESQFQYTIALKPFMSIIDFLSSATRYV